MTTLTEQEIFDKVATHLLTQQAKSLALDGTTCAYHDPRGRSCAVGCLIPKEVDTSLIEGMGIEVALGFRPEVFEKGGLTKERLSLLYALQNVHDNLSVHNWAGGLRQVAQSFRLAADTCIATVETP